jgi:DNA-binding transcriptional regulator YiaG
MNTLDLVEEEPQLRTTNSSWVYPVVSGMLLATSFAFPASTQAVWTGTSFTEETFHHFESAHTEPASAEKGLEQESKRSTPKTESTSNFNSVSDLRSLSGLTTDQIGRLFGVSRRSVHKWISGAPMSPHNEERLSTLLAIVSALPGNPDERRKTLLRSNSGMSIFHQQLGLVASDSELQVEPLTVIDQLQA